MQTYATNIQSDMARVPTADDPVGGLAKTPIISPTTKNARISTYQLLNDVKIADLL